MPRGASLDDLAAFAAVGRAHLALPLLKSFLSGQGVRVDVLDLNQLYLQDLMTPAAVRSKILELDAMLAGAAHAWMRGAKPGS